MNPSLSEALVQIQAELGQPYPETLGPPVWQAPSAHLSNLLRNGPSRKVFLLHHDSGDCDYDEAMTDEVEFRMESEALVMYKQALVLAEACFGTGRGFDSVPFDLLPPDVDEDERREDDMIDGERWTEEVEGGVVSHDSRRLRTWIVGHQLVCLQAGKWQGDGNFAIFVAVTLTGAATALEAARLDTGCEADDPETPVAIRDLQRRLGYALEELPQEGLPGPFFRRNVMSTRSTYARNAAGQVTGLNLATADLVDLSVLEAFPHLERLNLDDNALHDVDALRALANLRELSLRANRLPASADLGTIAGRLVHPPAFIAELAPFG